MTNHTYRYFTGKPLWMFGHGLSYTTFNYLTPKTQTSRLTAGGTLKLQLPVRNIGNRDGEEMVQIYLKHKDSPVPQPLHLLIAYKRVSIAKGVMANLDFEIPVERFHY